MAETLGSLIDKLSIKNIRLQYLKDPRKKKIVAQQCQDLIAEIDEFIEAAIRNKVKLKEEKLKLYNPPLKKIKTSSLAKLTNGLVNKNLQLWNLEDEVRAKGITLSQIGRLKKKIDIANQQRNDLIDGIDELLEKHLPKIKRRKTLATKSHKK